MQLTVDHTSARMEIAANRPHKKVLIGFPAAFCQYTRSVAAHVNRRSDLKRSGHWVGQLHEHPHGDAILRPAQKGTIHARLPVQL
jgi:hypothetical protein